MKKGKASITEVRIAIRRLHKQGKLSTAKSYYKVYKYKGGKLSYANIVK